MVRKSQFENSNWNSQIIFKNWKPILIRIIIFIGVSFIYINFKYFRSEASDYYQKLHDGEIELQFTEFRGNYDFSQVLCI